MSQPTLMPLRVLLIDDDVDVANLIEVLIDLDDRFSLVGVADSAPVGIDLAAEHRPDVIVLDLHLPGMNGFDAIPSLREVGGCPIVVFSAFPDVYTLLDVVSSGADSYLNKATAWAELLPTLASVCELVGSNHHLR